MSNSYKPLSTSILGAMGSISFFLSDNGSSSYRPLCYAASKIHRPPHVLANVLLVLALSMLYLDPAGLAPVLSSLICTSVGTWGTMGYLLGMKGLAGDSTKENGQREMMRKWLDYWVIYASISTVDNVLGKDLVIKLVPIWYVGKVGISSWIVMADGSNVSNLTRDSSDGASVGFERAKEVETEKSTIGSDTHDKEIKNMRKPRGLKIKRVNTRSRSSTIIDQSPASPIQSSPSAEETEIPLIPPVPAFPHAYMNQDDTSHLLKENSSPDNLKETADNLHTPSFAIIEMESKQSMEEKGKEGWKEARTMDQAEEDDGDPVELDLLQSYSHPGQHNKD